MKPGQRSASAHLWCQHLMGVMRSRRCKYLRHLFRPSSVEVGTPLGEFPYPNVHRSLLKMDHVDRIRCTYRYGRSAVYLLCGKQGDMLWPPGVKYHNRCTNLAILVGEFLLYRLPSVFATKKSILSRRRHFFFLHLYNNVDTEMWTLNSQSLIIVVSVDCTSIELTCNVHHASVQYAK